MNYKVIAETGNGFRVYGTTIDAQSEDEAIKIYSDVLKASGAKTWGMLFTALPDGKMELSKSYLKQMEKGLKELLDANYPKEDKEMHLAITNLTRDIKRNKKLQK